jgi:hypothetical protein
MRQNEGGFKSAITYVWLKWVGVIGGWILTGYVLRAVVFVGLGVLRWRGRWDVGDVKGHGRDSSCSEEDE